MLNKYLFNAVPFNYSETIVLATIVSTKALKAKCELEIDLKSEYELSTALEAYIELDKALKAKAGD